MNINKRIARWMNNYSGIIDFDSINDIATVNFYFESADELIDENLSSLCFSFDVVEKLKSVLERIPSGFNVNYIINVKDYKEYDKEELKKAFFKTVDMLDFNIEKKHRRISRQMIKYLILGIIVAIIMVICKKYSVFKSSGPIFSMIAVMLINIRFELLFEEGVTFFAVNNSTRKLDYKHFKRFNNIIFK